MSTSPAAKIYVARREPMSYECWRQLGWDEKQAREMAAEGQLELKAYVQVLDPVGGVYQQYELEHHAHHSPSGFEIGYAGSGPADLARSILIDHLGGLEALARDAFGDVIVPAYQDFKRKFVAPAQNELRVSSAEITAWMVLEHAVLDLESEGL